MKIRLFVPLFSITLLLSASLLFSVQPMFSKMILPLLGGTPNVWNTAMLFFQVVLLLGYAYAHATSRFLSIRVQAVIHLILLGIFTIVLPLNIPEGWLPDVNADPTLWQLSMMAMTVGGPFFVLAASAPMLQRWFANSQHPDSDNPYFLYGASNLGSMGSLLLYPVLAEPFLTLLGQTSWWMYGYFILIALIAAAAFLIWPQADKAAKAQENVSKNIHKVTWTMRYQWLALAFIPSSLMLGVTTYITTDIASAPLIWIIPLAIYVGTFILVFAKKPILNSFLLSIIHGALMSVLALLLLAHFGTHKWTMIGLHLVVFSFTAWMCHSILAAKRPDSSHLTEFYLLMSAGGALGGFFNAIIAPQLFTSPVEYPIVLAAACFCRFWDKPAESKTETNGDKRASYKDYILPAIGLSGVLIATLIKGNDDFAMVTLTCALIVFCTGFSLIDKRWSYAFVVAFAIMTHQPSNRLTDEELLHTSRNFFGIINIFDKNNIRTLMHGTTAHGMQSTIDEYKLLNISYYSEFSPLNDVFTLFDDGPEKQQVAVLGLGTGATACFDRPGRHFDFFEIDPAVVEVAQDPKLFSYLSDCGTPYEVILGDARMTIQDMPDEKYDMILLDVFSSDNIPIHVMTEEAVRIYLSKLKPDGILTFHISNNYLDLEPVLAKIAERIDIPAYGHITMDSKLEESGIPVFSSHYFMMTHDQEKIAALKEEGWSEAITRKGVESWNDQFSNIISVLGNTTFGKRYRMSIENNVAQRTNINKTRIKMEPITLDQEAEHTIMPNE